MAIDADTGEIKSHFQYTPHDVWDYDSTMEHILFDLDGQKLAAHFDKNGFLYILDRTTMDPVRVAPFVDRIDWGEVDEKGNVTPKVFPDKEGDPVHFWPGPAGAKEWTHACYNPNTELLYARCRTSARRPPGAAGSSRRASRTGAPASPWTSRTWPARSAPSTRAPARSAGAGRNDIPMCSSLLTTGGGIVFGGEPTGEFNALDADTGELLWQFQCGSGHHSSPCAFSGRRQAVPRRADRLGRMDGGVPARDARGRPGQRPVRLRAAGLKVTAELMTLQTQLR